MAEPMAPDGEIGRSPRRREDPPLISGRGMFAGDLRLPGMAHMAVCRSPVPHGRLVAVDLDAARKAPGVLAALSAADLTELVGTMASPQVPGAILIPRPVLATDRVRYTGEPVAVVVAESSYQAADAAQLVGFEIEPLDGAGDVTAAAAPGAPALHEACPGNLAGRLGRDFGDVEAAFERAEVVVRETVRLGRVAGGYLEPRASTACWDEEGGRLEVWTSTQWVYGVREQIASCLGIEPGRIRVVAGDVGGAFGAKGQPYPEEVLVAAIARRLRRPVQWVGSRSEDTMATAHSHGTVLELALAATGTGVLLGIRARLVHDLGAYASAGAAQADNILTHVLCGYRVPALGATIDLVYTNAVPCGFIRGGGREVGNFAIERSMDALARRLDVDPLDLRRRNAVSPAEMPYQTCNPGVRYDGGDYPQLLERAAAAVDYAGVRRRQAAGERIGIGIALCVEQTGMGSPESARLQIGADGRARIHLGSTPTGQGHRTAMAQVVAARLGWPLEQVEVVVGDSSAVAFSQNTAASRSALEVGNAAALAARAARRSLLERAAELLEADPADLVLSPMGGAVKGAPASSVPLAELLPEGGLEVIEIFTSRRAYASGCHAALVAADPGTGSVRLLRYVIAHDSGRTINPQLVEGQLQGGFAHGLGYAFFEEAVYLPDGTFVSPSFLDYTIPSPPELATEPELISVTSEVFGDHEGFKGVGESGTIPAASALAAAVEDALRRAGVETHLTRLPMTPLRIFEAGSGAL